MIQQGMQAVLQVLTSERLGLAHIRSGERAQSPGSNGKHASGLPGPHTLAPAGCSPAPPPMIYRHSAHQNGAPSAAKSLPDDTYPTTNQLIVLPTAAAHNTDTTQPCAQRRQQTSTAAVCRTPAELHRQRPLKRLQPTHLACIGCIIWQENDDIQPKLRVCLHSLALAWLQHRLPSHHDE